MFLQIKSEIEVALTKEFKHKIILEEPKVPGAGDLAFSTFKIASESKKDPKVLAAEISKSLSEMNLFYVKQISPIGPYVNIWLDWQRIAGKIFSDLPSICSKAAPRGESVVIDYSSPNPAHPLHMGTLRSTIIGEALSRILEWRGYDVKRICYINDMGKQAMTLLLGYKMFGKGNPDKKPDIWLGEIYKRASDASENSDIEEQIFKLLRLYEQGDRETVETGKKIFNLCIKGFKESWDVLDVHFDEIVWESEFSKKSQEVLAKLNSAGILEDADGARVLKLAPKYPNTIIVRKDGTGLYLLRDLAFAIWKYEKFKPSRNIYIVGEDQKLHFQQMFYTLSKIGYSDLASKSVHIGYSMVLFQGQKMSSRRGSAVFWDDVYAEGLDKAMNEVEKRWPELTEGEIKKRSSAIALAAIKYFILKYSPEKPINFSWNDALRFEGDAGPYLQYTYARSGAILEKAKKVKDFDETLLKDEREIELVKVLSRFSAALHDAATKLSPHILANYAFDLANKFNSFYEGVPVLSAEENERDVRLKLVESTHAILGICLDLLSIPKIEKM
jgi:arginyl-tRNA synthetase